MMDSTEKLLDEVRLLWHAMVRAGERLHRKEPITMGMRGVLELLALRGPATVPHIARSRGVTRQHIQSLVNSLLDLRLVALQNNPMHRRSALVLLTPAGERLFARVRERERRFLASVAPGLGPSDLARAATVLGAVRKSLEVRR